MCADVCCGDSDSDGPQNAPTKSASMEAHSRVASVSARMDGVAISVNVRLCTTGVVLATRPSIELPLGTIHFSESSVADCAITAGAVTSRRLLAALPSPSKLGFDDMRVEPSLGDTLKRSLTLL